MKVNAPLGFAVVVLGSLLVASLTFTYIFWREMGRTEIDYQRAAARCGLSTPGTNPYPEN
jgi:hypothetical protein